MKREDFGFVRWRVLALSLLLLSCGFSGLAHCRTARIALLIQQTPSEGGTVAPSAGVHYFAPGSEVKLVAVAKPGYQFLYWLGDVSDPSSGRTIAYLDGPKIVIAVFAKIPEEQVVAGGASSVGRSRSVGGGGIASRAERPAHSNPWRRPPPKRPKPIPIVEPSTILVLGLAVAMVLRRQRPF